MHRKERGVVSATSQPRDRCVECTGEIILRVNNKFTLSNLYYQQNSSGTIPLSYYIQSIDILQTFISIVRPQNMNTIVAMNEMRRRSRK